MFGARGEISPGLKDDGAGPGGDGLNSEVAKKMICGNAGYPHLQGHGPLEEHGQAVRRGVAGEERSSQNHGLEEARLDIGVDRVAAIAVGVPEREVAPVELVRQERKHGQLDAPEVPGK